MEGKIPKDPFWQNVCLFGGGGLGVGGGQGEVYKIMECSYQKRKRNKPPSQTLALRMSGMGG